MVVIPNRNSSTSDYTCICSAVNQAGQQCYDCLNSANAANSEFADALDSALGICTSATGTGGSGGSASFTPVGGASSGLDNVVAISTLAASSPSATDTDNAAGRVGSPQLAGAAAVTLLSTLGALFGAMRKLKLCLPPLVRKRH